MVLAFSTVLLVDLFTRLAQALYVLSAGVVNLTTIFVDKISKLWILSGILYLHSFGSLDSSQISPAVERILTHGHR